VEQGVNEPLPPLFAFNPAATSILNLTWVSQVEQGEMHMTKRPPTRSKQEPPELQELQQLWRKVHPRIEEELNRQASSSTDTTPMPDHEKVPRSHSR
jgi:hypothetical protein